MALHTLAAVWFEANFNAETVMWPDGFKMVTCWDWSETWHSCPAAPGVMWPPARLPPWEDAALGDISGSKVGWQTRRPAERDSSSCSRRLTGWLPAEWHSLRGEADPDACWPRPLRQLSDQPAGQSHSGPTTAGQRLAWSSGVLASRYGSWQVLVAVPMLAH